LTFFLKVVASLYKKNIQRLTKTFLTLSLADVASRVQLSDPAEAEKYILNMVSLAGGWREYSEIEIVSRIPDQVG
jgi:PCI domain